MDAGCFHVFRYIITTLSTPQPYTHLLFTQAMYVYRHLSSRHLSRLRIRWVFSLHDQDDCL